VKAAGGVLIEVMPGVEEEIVEKIQENADAYKINVSEEILTGKKPSDLVAPYMKGLAYTEIPHDHQVKYFCSCTQERVKRALETLGQTDLQEMIESREPAEITCQMCGRHYKIGIPELEELKEALYRNSLN
jgi:molecular chaperone Hsp33